MQKPAKNKLSYLIIFLILPLFSVLYYQERKQSYESKVESGPLVELGEMIQTKEKKIKTSNEKKRIAVTNGITKEMLTYNHWSGSYAPTTFVITIAGNQIAYNETAQIEIGAKENVVIRYDYSFVNGYKTGSREIEFVISPEKNDYVLSFAWQDPAHLVLEDAFIEKTTVVPFNKSLESKKA